MVARAASWVAGVTPAQQALSTEISISGKFAFSIRALDTTQMSVHSPTSSSIEDIREYCRLCLMEESEENLRARYAIIRKQREEAYKRVEEAKATARYMDDKVAHYEAILAGLAPDDTNPKNWTAENRPKHGDALGPI